MNYQAPSRTANTTIATLTADEQSARRIADCLAEAFFADEAAVSLVDAGRGRWCVTCYFRANVNEAAVRALAIAVAGVAACKALRFERIAAKDWVAESLLRLKPITAGRFVVHGAHDRGCAPPNRFGIEIEAALAFGTGHHGTTRGCLLLLDHLLKARRRPARVLDLGSGTGVLAIAAAKALHKGVLASDIDGPSVRVARDNARLNEVGRLVEVIRATGFAAPDFARHGPFDLVLANILANPLRQLAGPLSAHLAPSALVILSGLLTPQARSVIAAYRARGLVPLRHLKIEGWSSLLLQLS